MKQEDMISHQCESLNVELRDGNTVSVARRRKMREIGKEEKKKIVKWGATDAY